MTSGNAVTPLSTSVISMIINHARIAFMIINPGDVVEGGRLRYYLAGGSPRGYPVTTSPLAAFETKH